MEEIVNAAARPWAVTGSEYATEGLAAASEGAGPTRLTDAEVEDLSDKQLSIAATKKYLTGNQLARALAARGVSSNVKELQASLLIASLQAESTAAKK